MRIYISGSMAYDRIMDFPGKFGEHILPDKLHILNVCFLVNGLQEKFGGTAGNIAYNLALLGEKPTILSVYGDDFDRYEKWLNKHGLSMEGLVHAPGVLTAGAYITTDKADNQITAFNPGAMAHSTDYAFDGLDPADAIAIVSPGNLDDMRHYPRVYRERGAPYIFDPGQNITAFTGVELMEMITGARILICNDYELEMIRRAVGLDNNGLLEHVESIIVTLGEQGSRVVASTGETAVAAVKARDVADPTGAGDAYRSGLVKGLVMGKPLPEAAQLGSTCASFAVEHLGTQEHHFTEDEFWARHKQAFGSA